MVPGSEALPLQETSKPLLGESKPALAPLTIFSHNFYFYAIVLIANFLSFSAGFQISWVTPVIPKLNATHKENPFHRAVSSGEIAWLAGLLPLGAITGPLAAGKISDLYGRKKTLLAAASLHIVSLLIPVLFDKIYLYFIARFIAGLAFGSVFTVLPVYLYEISEDQNRGAVGCLMNFFVAVGINFSLIVGPPLTIKNYCLACLVSLIMFVTCFTIFAPDSPVYLASSRKDRQLDLALKKLRNKTAEDIAIDKEIILNRIANMKGVTQNFTSMLETPVYRRGLTICLVLVFFQQSAGLGAILAYMPQIFQIARVNMPSNMCVILVGSFQIVGIIISTIIVDKVGRKILLFISCVGACITLFIVGLYFSFADNNEIFQSLGWLPLLSLIIFIVCFGIGLGPIPWVLAAELFPQNVRSKAASLTSIVGFFTTFLVVWSFPYLEAYFGMAKCFLLFCCFQLAGSFFVYFSVPETKGKTLEEIQQMLEKN